MRRLLRSAALILAGAAAGLLLLTPAASGHAELVSSDPPEGANLDSPPRTMTLTFSETPAEQSEVKVKDGCDRDVAGAASTSGKTIELALDDAQPGRWKVVYEVLSADDGHDITGDYLLEVSGKADCSGGGASAAGDEADEGGSNGLILALGAGAALLVAIAFMVRRSGSR